MMLHSVVSDVTSGDVGEACRAGNFEKGNLSMVFGPCSLNGGGHWFRTGL
jgi:hypothetical protein